MKMPPPFICWYCSLAPLTQSEERLGAALLRAQACHREHLLKSHESAPPGCWGRGKCAIGARVAAQAG